ncbi:hypothetical protein [Nocardia otitidiscaviarum]|uniref:hypothetical protein n=1 Tax=Nocardia otitidiscaviarum TaxID=1823 RepID=UPI0024580D8E|nr:hypothetical protein [Nocardia otitidiscaviarum]
MSRTPEQIAADNALTEAIDAVWRAYDDDPDPGLLLDYTVVATRRGIDNDGDTWTSVGAFSRDDNVPVHVQMGLLLQRLTRLKQQLADED